MAKMSISTYSPSDVKLVIGGYTIVGWDNVTISRRSQGFITIPGIRGKHTRVPSGDSSATITFSLIQTSPSNDVMSAIHELDLVEGTGRIALTLTDLSGRSVFNSIEAYIVGYPEVTFLGSLNIELGPSFVKQLILIMLVAIPNLKQVWLIQYLA